TLDRQGLIDRFRKTPEERNTSQDSHGSPMSAGSLAGYKAFSRPAGSGARFIGASGAPDHLPSLPDGDITLLNTKANQFAVFVRRVATQVFGELRLTGWESLLASDI